jgi:hypothetical protein
MKSSPTPQRKARSGYRRGAGYANNAIPNAYQRHHGDFRATNQPQQQPASQAGAGLKSPFRSDRY